MRASVDAQELRSTGVSASSARAILVAIDMVCAVLEAKPDAEECSVVGFELRAIQVLMDGYLELERDIPVGTGCHPTAPMSEISSRPLFASERPDCSPRSWCRHLTPALVLTVGPGY